ncbi:MAG: hypothetical protein PF505_04900 [Vallitaleaceae bacterium]|jgi:hypothetical protein|nr:hypothetical protein [Vallitaleaceae bacterium]
MREKSEKNEKRETKLKREIKHKREAKQKTYIMSHRYILLIILLTLALLWTHINWLGIIMGDSKWVLYSLNHSIEQARITFTIDVYENTPESINKYSDLPLIDIEGHYANQVLELEFMEGDCQIMMISWDIIEATMAIDSPMGSMADIDVSNFDLTNTDLAKLGIDMFGGIGGGVDSNVDSEIGADIDRAVDGTTNRDMDGAAERTTDGAAEGTMNGTMDGNRLLEDMTQYSESLVEQVDVVHMKSHIVLEDNIMNQFLINNQYKVRIDYLGNIHGIEGVITLGNANYYLDVSINY